MRITAALLVSIFVLGCGAKSEEHFSGSPSTKRSEELSEANEAAMKKRIVEAVPPGGSHVMVDYEKGRMTGFSVVYSRPGYLHNSVWFEVNQSNNLVKVKVYSGSGNHGEFEYENGKLKKEKAGETTQSEWPWIQQRAGEVAKAWDKVTK